MTEENRKKVSRLNRYLKITNEIERLQDEIAKTKLLREQVASSLSDTSASTDAGNLIEVCTEQIEKLTGALRDSLYSLVLAREQVESIILTVQDERLKTLLLCRYVNGMTWEEIAIEMNYCYRQVCRLHGDALAKVKMS